MRLCKALGTAAVLVWALLGAACAASVPESIVAEAGDAARATVVDRSDSLLYYFENGVCCKEIPVVVGALGSPTPVGEWRVVKMETLEKGTAYGIRKISLERLDSKGEWEEGPYALHGTDEPHLLSESAPRMFSNGCIRMADADVAWFYERTELHDRVVVVP